MANHKSSIKRIRQTIVRTERNRFYRTRLKNIVKDVRTAVDAGKSQLNQNVTSITFVLGRPCHDLLLCLSLYSLFFSCSYTHLI